MLTARSSDALPRRYARDLRAAIRIVPTQRLCAAGVTLVWTGRYRQVGYLHEIELGIWKIRPTNRSLMSYVEEMFKNALVPPKMV